MKKLALLIITVTLITASCSNDELVTPLVITKSGNGTGQKQYEKWLEKYPFVVTTYYIAGQPANDQFLPCQLDNVLYFYDNGVFLELEGAMKCGVSDTADYGFWSVTDSTFYLNTHNIPNSTFEIVSFKPKHLSVTSPFLGGDLDAVK